MNAEESRKQFEAAVLTGDLLPVNSVRRNYMDCRAGDYESILTNVAWLAWQAAKAQPQWISVSERLPFDGESVLIFDKSGTYGAIYTLQYYDDFILKHKYVTHWMPLPASPEQNK